MKLSTIMTLSGAMCLLLAPIISLLANSGVGIIISVIGAILIIQSVPLKSDDSRRF